MKAIKIETINSCWRKLCPDAVYDFTGFMAEPIKEIMKEIVDIGGKKYMCCGERVSRYASWRNSSSNRHHTRGIHRRLPDGDECLLPNQCLTMRRKKMRRRRRSRVRKQTGGGGPKMAEE